MEFEYYVHVIGTMPNLSQSITNLFKTLKVYSIINTQPLNTQQNISEMRLVAPIRQFQ